MKELFDTTTKLLSKALEYTDLRHKLLSNNIANLDTPNYKAVDLKFEDALRQSLDGQKRNHQLVAYTSNGDVKANGNTVSIEAQIMKMTENNILHHSFVNLIKLRFKMLESAINNSNF